MGNRFNNGGKFTINLKNKIELETIKVWISLNGLIRN